MVSESAQVLNQSSEVHRQEEVDIKVGSLWTKKTSKGRITVKVYKVIMDGHRNSIVAYRFLDGSNRAGMVGASYFVSDYERVSHLEEES